MLSTGIIVSFNGNGYDLVKLSKFTRATFGGELESKEHSSRYDADHLRDPLAADPETAPITGQNLVETYRHYFACASTSQSAVDRFQWEGTSGAFQEEMSLM